MSPLPDPDLRWNPDRDAHDYGEPDWSEFKAVISGSGPANVQRLAHRRRAHEHGAWVREAATVYAAKQRASSAQTGHVAPGARSGVAA